VWRKPATARRVKLKVNAGTSRDRYMKSVQQARSTSPLETSSRSYSPSALISLRKCALNIYRALRTVNSISLFIFPAHGRHARAGSSPEMLVRVTHASWSTARLLGPIREAVTKQKIQH